jgi:hypothetical protein
MDAQMERDYAFYKARMTQAQMEEDATSSWLHIPPRDLAWEKTVERAKSRGGMCVKWSDIQRQVRDNAALRAYTQAIS